MNYLVIVATSICVNVAYEMARATIRAHKMSKRITIELPRGTSFSDRLRVTRAVVRFAESYDNATPEKREKVLSWLEKQDGASVTKIV